MVNVIRVTFLFLTMSVPSARCITACSSLIVGNTECIRADSYYGSQWATCLSRSYIQQKSNNRHSCNLFASYCWYQCMLELHEKESGFVTQDCACGSGHPQLTTKAPVSLPSWCYSPDGTQCSWYRDCLEVKYQCEATSSPYAIDYAERFCNLYTQNYNSFSPQGQQWINAVRKCLQVALVPTLRPWMSDSCSDIKKKALESHSVCYLNVTGAPSICQLPVTDWIQVFWTIKGAIVKSFSESLKGMMDVVTGCVSWKSLSRLVSPYFVTMNINVKYNSVGSYRGKRSTDDRIDAFIGDTADAIAEHQNWDDNGISWFTFKRQTTSAKVSMTIMIGPKEMDLNYGGTVQNADLVNATKALADNVKNGTLSARLPNGERVKVETINACRGMKCTDSFVSVDLSRANNSVCSFLIAVTSVFMVYLFSKCSF